MRRRHTANLDLPLEESIGDAWVGLEVAEVPLSNRPFYFLGLVITLLAVTVFGRIFFLGTIRGDFYRLRAIANVGENDRTPAPRGLILDRNGTTLADNRPVFVALLHVAEFVHHKELQDETLSTIQRVLGLIPSDVLALVQNAVAEGSLGSVVLSPAVTQSQLIQLQSIALPAIVVKHGFQRYYTDGAVFSSVLGYTGLVTADDLNKRSNLDSEDVIGKTGIEYFYDEKLGGTPGITVALRDSKGKVFDGYEKQPPRIGHTLTLTIDGDFQKYFHDRLQQGLQTLGRDSAAGIAINPHTGEVLALLSFPTFDANVFTMPGRNDEKKAVLTSPTRPLFNRAVGGLYSPGSTIKPLVGIAALKEGVIDPERQLFSPGYIDIPNPYHPDEPTRYEDWRYQGWVNLAAAIAQSSDVYFYLVGGGSPVPTRVTPALDGQGGVSGLGISRLNEWWKKFNLGSLTNIDLPGEARGLLPSAALKETQENRPWLLGDTYNVSIGQGKLLLTPIQLISYIDAVANNGKVLRPFLASEYMKPQLLQDLTNLTPEIKEVQKGMVQAVRSPLGSLYTMRDLPFSLAGKTGTAQIKNNAQENAFFIGYAPAENPQVAILVLVENAKSGSLNAIPIAKDVLNWYYMHRLQKK